MLFQPGQSQIITNNSNKCYSPTRVKLTELYKDLLSHLDYFSINLKLQKMFSNNNLAAVSVRKYFEVPCGTESVPLTTTKTILTTLLLTAPQSTNSRPWSRLAEHVSPPPAIGPQVVGLGLFHSPLQKLFFLLVLQTSYCCITHTTTKAVSLPL